MKRIINIGSIALIVLAIALLLVLTNSEIQAKIAFSQQPSYSSMREVESSAFEGFPEGQMREIEFQIDDAYSDRMTRLEQQDQALDWLLFTIVWDSGLPLDMINQSLYDVAPIRYGYMYPVANFEYGVTRSLYLGDGMVIALVPADESEEERAYQLALIADQQRKNTGAIPDSIVLFKYNLDLEQHSGEVTRLETLDGSALFTPEYGYHEAEIVTLDDLQTFLAEVEDITYAELLEPSSERTLLHVLRLGGRQYDASDYTGIDVEDVAALWQAHVQILDVMNDFESWERRVEEFDSFWSNQTYRTQSERIALERTMQRQSDNLEREYQELLERFGVDGEGVGLVNGTGFSLDPHYDYEGLSEFFALSRETYDSIAGQPGASIDSRDIELAAEGLAQEDEVPYLSLLFALENDPDLEIAEMANWDSEIVRGVFRYQTARYDGDLQGTEVGMTLFYTDLMAKLWGFDFQQTAPDGIEGFVPSPQQQLPPIYRQEVIELPSTRLWFGPQNRGFQLAEAGESLLFSHVATQVYAASSNPLEPGVEVSANTPNTLFLGWWNSHYGTVARYEPQYEQLNQIMKWSLLISWLGHNDQERLLNYLADVEVDRSNWFPDWVQEHPELRYQKWDDIEFLEQGYLGTSTEAIGIVYSDSYTMFTDDEAQGIQWYLSGGVSLADIGLFDDLVPLTSEIDSLLLRSSLDYGDDIGGLVLRTLDDIEYNFAANLLGDFSDDALSITARATGENARLRSIDGEILNQPIARVVDEFSFGQGIEFNTLVSDVNLGTLNIIPEENGFKVGWLGRDIDHAYQIGLEASRGTPVSTVLSQRPTVGAIIETADDAVLFRMSGSNKWMRMSIADESMLRVGVPDGYQAIVADQHSAVQGILLDWSDDVTGQFNQGYLSWNGAESSLLKHVDDIPSGLYPVQIDSGDFTFIAHMNSETGDIFYALDDLPSVMREDISFDVLSNLLDPSDVRVLQNQADDVARVIAYEVSETRLGELRPLVGRLADDDYMAVARQIVLDPAGTKNALDDILVENFNRIDDLLMDGHSDDALRWLDDLVDTYGHSPDIDLRRGLANLDEGNVQQAANIWNQSPVDEMTDTAPFFDEINMRLQNNPDPNYYRAGEFADWQGLHAQQGLEGHILAAVDDSDKMVLHYRLGDTPGDTIETFGNLSEDVVVYVQDSPALNNLDWNVSIEGSLREVVSGDLGEVVALPRGDLAYFRPAKIYTADEVALVPVVESVNTPLPRFYQPVARSALELDMNCFDDSDENCDNSMVYLVVSE